VELYKVLKFHEIKHLHTYKEFIISHEIFGKIQQPLEVSNFHVVYTM